MKNLTKLTVIGALISVSGFGHAVDTQLTGSVSAVCEAEFDSGSALNFGLNPQGGDTQETDVEIRCNDSDGATVKLQSSEGGLESDDNEDFSVEYTARLAEATTGLDLNLTTTPGVGQNDEFVDQSISGSLNLAGGVTAQLEVVLEDTPVWAGGYSDTLSIEITAN